MAKTTYKLLCGLKKMKKGKWTLVHMQPSSIRRLEVESHITTEELISLIEEEFDVSREGEYLLDMTDNRTCSENVAAYIRQHKNMWAAQGYIWP